MRPLKLVMQAFGSYGNRTEIDFEKPDQNLFLITGNTGSGKTTIFDAIVFALYGEASSNANKKNGAELQSQFVEIGTEPFVSLTFSEKNGTEIDLYTVKRIPRHVRPLKRGSGEKMVSEEVSLTMPDGSEYPAKETDAKLMEIVGLTKEQFMQVAMIAQGEFMELLRAKSDDKKMIFRKLFHTGLYEEIKNEFAVRKKEKQAEIDQIRMRCIAEISRTELPEGSEYTAFLKEKKKELEKSKDFSVTVLEQFLEKLELLCMELSKQTKEAKKITQERSRERDRARDAAAKASQLLKFFVQLEDAEKTLQSLKEQEEAITEQQELADQWKELCELSMPEGEKVLEAVKNFLEYEESCGKVLKKESEELKKQSETLRMLIQKKAEKNKIFDRLEMEEKSLLLLNAKQDEMETCRVQAVLGHRAEQARHLEVQALRTAKSVRQIQGEIEQITVWQKEQEKELSEVKEKAEELEEVFAKVEPEMLKRISQLLDLLPHYANVRKYSKEYENQTGAMQRCIQNCQEASAQYEEAYAKFFQEQAGILAKELQEGTPCPVCGSVEHPHPAKISGEAPDKETVEKLKQRRDLLEQKRIQQQEKFQICKAQLESEQRILGDNPVKEEQVKEELQKMQVELDRKKNETKQAQEQCRKMTEESRRQAGKLEGLRGQKAELEKRFVKEQEEFREEISRQEFTSQEEFREAKQWIEGWREKDKEVKEHDRQLLEKKAKIETLKEQTAGEKREDPQQEIEKRNEVEHLLKEKQDHQMQLHSRWTGNQNAYKNLKQYFSSQEALRKEYEVLSNLSKTANGNLSGSVKLDFETYVQRTYFRQIIQAANRRLARMTSNEFILQCREIQDLSSQGQAGLDLDVYDLVTDSVRDVKSLSGGESFMAALSMALGLADIIQNTAGAVSLETMFVDEGFGSLDDASRDRAIQILKELAGEKGLVGIISHVNELKEQIDWKLNITKTEHGSQAKWEI